MNARFYVPDPAWKRDLEQIGGRTNVTADVDISGHGFTIIGQGGVAVDIAKYVSCHGLMGARHDHIPLFIGEKVEYHATQTYEGKEKKPAVKTDYWKRLDFNHTGLVVTGGCRAVYRF